MADTKVYWVKITTKEGARDEFELRHEPLSVGDSIRHEGAAYKVDAIAPDPDDRYDAIIEAKWWIGPGHRGLSRPALEPVSN